MPVSKNRGSRKAHKEALEARYKRKVEEKRKERADFMKMVKEHQDKLEKEGNVPDSVKPVLDLTRPKDEEE